MIAMIAAMMIGTMATIGGGGCDAGEMLFLLKRHEIQVLLSVGIPPMQIAERVGVSVDTVERVRSEPEVTHGRAPQTPHRSPVEGDALRG